MSRLEFVASLATVTLPESLPETVGLKRIWKECVCPATIETADMLPTRLKPEPVTAASEMVTEAAPVFVSTMVCRLLDPATTFPKFKLAALALRVPVVVEPVDDLDVDDLVPVRARQPEMDRSEMAKTGRTNSESAVRPVALFFALDPLIAVLIANPTVGFGVEITLLVRGTDVGQARALYGGTRPT